MSSTQQLAASLRPNISRYVPRRFIDGLTIKQTAFLLCKAKEAGYGGAAGGGKSSAMLIDALQYIHVPGYSAILFRRTFSDLAKPKALMDLAGEWFRGTNARWSERDKVWTFPTDGKETATLGFGYMDTEVDRFNYLGAEYQYWGMDEVTMFSERMYTFGFSRLRRPAGFPVPIKMRSATNPGGPGHAWYKRRFLIEGAAKGRIFIPAGLRDNPNLDIDEYIQGMAELDPVTREQYLNGNWDVQEGGGQFDRGWFNDRIRPRSKVPPMVKIVRAWDFAATKPSSANPDPDWTVGVKVGLDAENNYWILDVRRIRDNAGEVRKFVQDTAEEDGLGVKVCGEQEPGSSGKLVSDLFQREILQGFETSFTRSTGKKEVRARIVAQAAQQGWVYLQSGPWNSDFLDELELFCDGCAHDDQVDAVSLGFQKLKKTQGQMHFGQDSSYRVPRTLELPQPTYGREPVLAANRQDPRLDAPQEAETEAEDPRTEAEDPRTAAALKRGRQFFFKGGV